MVTTVGTESAYQDLLRHLVALEHDALAAYEACIERLDGAEARAKLAEFRDDHRRHLAELTEIASADRIEVPGEGDAKQVLTTGKVKLAGLLGDGTLLRAMASNESDTISAYERARSHPEVPASVRGIFERAHADELRHREWMQREAERA